MPQAISNKSRLAKNTASLFIRMLFTMGVSLYTSRVVLEILGIVDYGVYNVVSGVITMFAFINYSMTSATQRYITFAIGTDDKTQMEKVFCSSVQIHFLISLLILVLGETVGLWYVLHKLVIPATSQYAAMWVYQCSILTAMVGIMSIPYNSEIIAHEKMSAFAFISIFEAVLKLCVVFLLWIIPLDKLLIYGILLFMVQIMIRSIYGIYCRKHFKETIYHHSVDLQLLKNMGSFAGWSFFGNISSVLNGEGINQLLNLFFGPVVNAARAVAIQVQMAVQQLATNFQVAINPQITKSYAIGDLPGMHRLIFFSSRIAFTILFIVIMPLLIETPYVLDIWLKKVPPQSVAFTRLMLCITLLNPFSSPLSISNQATGNVRKFQLIIGGLLMTVLPISYIVLWKGYSAPSVYGVYFGVECIAVIMRYILLRNQISLSTKEFINEVIFRLLPVVILSPIVPLIIRNTMDEGFIRLLVICFTSVASVIFVSYSLGLKSTERMAIKKRIKSTFSKFIGK